MLGKSGGWGWGGVGGQGGRWSEARSGRKRAVEGVETGRWAATNGDEACRKRGLSMTHRATCNVRGAPELREDVSDFDGF